MCSVPFLFSLLPHRSYKMQIKFLIVTNAIIILAASIELPKNHRGDHQRVPSYSESTSKAVAKKDKIRTGPRKLKSDESMIVEHVKRKKDYENPWSLSKESDRIHFQIGGHKGPETYIFGFDTGSGKNRQYRLEERHHDGTVKGQYGYYDARGKLRTVRYVAKPFEGYTEIHHESDSRKQEK